MPIRAAFVGVAVAAALAFSASTANATRTATIAPGGSIELSGADLTLSNSIVSFFCDLRVTGSLLTTAGLDLGPGGLTRIGQIAGATASTCDGLLGIVFLDHPWHIAIVLPLPTGAGELARFQILDARFELELVSDVFCLFHGDLFATLADTNANGLGDTLVFDHSSNQIPLSSGTSFLCDLAGAAGVGGNLSVAPELSVALL